MENHIAQVAQRVRGLRLILDIPAGEMARAAGVSPEEYLSCEEGKRDFSFTFLFKCAQRFGVDIAELVTGETPRLKSYTVVRCGGGMPIERRQGFSYRHLAYLLRGRMAEPFLVTAKYSQAEQAAPILLNTHAGQEFDYVLMGRLKFQIDGHTELLNPGDSVYYNASAGHGMIAADGADCQFLAVVIPEKQEDA